VLDAGRAYAMTELCPAQAVTFTPQEAASGSAATYTYAVSAMTPRTLSATLLADTDHGWFTWTVRNVELVKTHVTLTNQGRSIVVKYVAADSPRLTVTFPQAVVLRHAWVSDASTTGEKVFGWDSRGDFRCRVPDFGQGKVQNGELRVADDLPAPPPPALAEPAPAPFPAATCAKPFVDAGAEALHPEFPDSLRERGDIAWPLVVMVYVTIDENGHLIDASILAKSGYELVDAEALRAARQSSYYSGTSYCQHVPGSYVVMAEFV